MLFNAIYKIKKRPPNFILDLEGVEVINEQILTLNVFLLLIYRNTRKVRL